MTDADTSVNSLTNPNGITTAEPAPKKRRRRTPKAAPPPPFCATAEDHERKLDVAATKVLASEPRSYTTGRSTGRSTVTFGQQIGEWIDSLGPGGGATLPDGIKYALGTMAGMALTAALARSRRKTE